MVFKLVHEVGNRTRWRTDGTMSLASAKLLADELEQTPGVTGLRVNPRTGSVVVTVADWDARERVARYFASLEKAPLITRVDTAAARGALAQAAIAKTESAASGDSAASSALSETIATVNRALSDRPGSVFRNTSWAAFPDATARLRAAPDRAPWRSPPRSPSAKKGRLTLRRSPAFSSCARSFPWDLTPRTRFWRAFPSCSRA